MKGRCGVEVGSIYGRQCVGGGIGETIEIWWWWWWLLESNRNVQKQKKEEQNIFFVVKEVVCLRSHQISTICGPRISERELEQFVAQ